MEAKKPDMVEQAGEATTRALKCDEEFLDAFG